MTMDSFDPEELIDDYQNEQQRRSELAVQALQWFLDDENICQLYPREDVVKNLAEELNINIEEADTAISDTVGDIVDPVQQITKISEKYVGVIDYKVFNDCGAYGYIDFDDKLGQRKRVVCAKCVEENVYDQNIAHATEGEGTMSQDSSWSDLLNRVQAHYENAHSSLPENIEPGASLLSGTTIDGNTAHHAGNYSAPVQSVNNQTGDVTISADAPVDSVNGQTGSVNLNYNDVGALPDSYSAPVDSVNGQTGAVSIPSPDLTWSLIHSESTSQAFSYTTESFGLSFNVKDCKIVIDFNYSSDPLRPALEKPEYVNGSGERIKPGNLVDNDNNIISFGYSNTDFFPDGLSDADRDVLANSTQRTIIKPQPKFTGIPGETIKPRFNCRLFNNQQHKVFQSVQVYYPATGSTDSTYKLDEFTIQGNGEGFDLYVYELS